MCVYWTSVLKKTGPSPHLYPHFEYQRPGLLGDKSLTNGLLNQYVL